MNCKKLLFWTLVCGVYALVAYGCYLEDQQSIAPFQQTECYATVLHVNRTRITATSIVYLTPTTGEPMQRHVEYVLHRCKSLLELDDCMAEGIALYDNQAKWTCYVSPLYVAKTLEEVRTRYLTIIMVLPAALLVITGA